MIGTRHYSAARRAWTPRFWPIALVATAVLLTILALVRLTIWEAMALGAIVGGGFGAGRWEVWKARHPVITPAEYIEDLQRAARWN